MGDSFLRGGDVEQVFNGVRMSGRKHLRQREAERSGECKSPGADVRPSVDQKKAPLLLGRCLLRRWLEDYRLRIKPLWHLSQATVQRTACAQPH